jgi:hypothetical protein
MGFVLTTGEDFDEFLFLYLVYFVVTLLMI